MSKISRKKFLALSTVLLIALLLSCYQYRYKLYYRFLGGKPSIVMIGNTLTQNGHWDELLLRHDVMFLKLQEPAVFETLKGIPKKVNELQPKICFIEGGANRLIQGETIERIKKDIGFLATQLKSAQVIPVIELNAYSQEDTLLNHNIDSLNQVLIEVAHQSGAEVIDLNSMLSSKGFLQKKYAKEPLLFTMEAYPQWAVLVAQMIQKHKI